MKFRVKSINVSFFKVPIFDGFSLYLHKKVCMARNLKLVVNFQILSKLSNDGINRAC